MKFVPAQIAYLLANRQARRDIRLLTRWFMFLAAMIAAYSAAFHYLMAREGQNHSWLTGFYWTLTVMSTLGFGDITFHSDLGRFFSIVVLISGVLFLLVVMPFAFIQFFLAPWLEAQSRARAPRELPATMKNHVLLTSQDAITGNLVEKLRHHRHRYAYITPDLKRALDLFDSGISVMVGELDDPETYRRARADNAALVVTTGSDPVNTSITFTVRELSPTVPIVAAAESEDSIDILKLAGSTHVFQFKEMLGRFLARRVIGMSGRVNVVGHFDELYIAEASVTRSPLVGKTIAASRLREVTGITVVGLWERGIFKPATAGSLITSASVLVMVGRQEQLDAFDELFCIYVASDAPVLVLGGGLVGTAVARTLRDREIDFRIVDQNPAVANSPKHVTGSAADLEILERAGLRDALSVVVTTNTDDINIYLTVYCRRLCPDIQIISRANSPKNVSTLHRAGADFVMSYASMSADLIMNVLEGEELLMFAEGLNVFRVEVPDSLSGLRLRDTRIRERAGAHVIAVTADGMQIPNPSPEQQLHSGEEMIVAGDAQSEQRLFDLYPDITRRTACNIPPPR